MDDTRIIDLYWQRSERAIAETDAKYGAYCRMVALNITGDTRDGEECVSDTWLAAWNSMPQARPAHLSAYLAAICRNRALNLARLPVEERRVFVARYWHMAAVDDIARAAGFSHAKVTAMLRRTRKKLAEQLRREGLE